MKRATSTRRKIKSKLVKFDVCQEKNTIKKTKIKQNPS
jgi:hypothetical protein